MLSSRASVLLVLGTTLVVVAVALLPAVATEVREGVFVTAVAAAKLDFDGSEGGRNDKASIINWINVKMLFFMNCCGCN